EVNHQREWPRTLRLEQAQEQRAAAVIEVFDVINRELVRVKRRSGFGGCAGDWHACPPRKHHDKKASAPEIAGRCKQLGTRTRRREGQQAPCLLAASYRRDRQLVQLSQERRFCRPARALTSVATNAKSRWFFRKVRALMISERSKPLAPARGTWPLPLKTDQR